MTQPPLDASLNLSQILDLHVEPPRLTTAYALADGKGGITSVSHYEFVRAAHRAAHILRPGREGQQDGQVVAIIANADVLIYQTLVAGCIKAGLVPFPISPRNSPAAIVHLLKCTDSHRLLTTRQSLGQLADGLTASLSQETPVYELSVEEIPLLGQLYPHLGAEGPGDDPSPLYPSPERPVPVDDVALYLHSSGSTGFPKAIPESHRTLIYFAGLECLSEVVEVSPRFASGAVPAFHTIGIMTQLIQPMLNCGTVCLYALASTATEYRAPPALTPQNALDHAILTKADGIMAVPAVLLMWQSPAHLAYLKTLKLVCYSGGPLVTPIGNAMASLGINIVSVYGGTEFGAATKIKRVVGDLSEWDWLEFSDRVDIRWAPQGDNVFECQFLSCATHQGAIENLPDVKGYATKDLYEKHPSKNLYKLIGRLDDVITMANGEKTVPGPMEDVMIADPNITGAVMFGRERNQVGVLIEPAPQHKIDPRDETQLAEFRNLIWDTIQEANENAPAFARLYKEMVLVTYPDKPLVRAPKGTIIKKAALAVYEQEIDTLYDTVENSTTIVDPPASWTPSDVEKWLLKQAGTLTDKEILPGKDIFDQGFDSLNATFLRHRIVGSLKASAEPGVKAAASSVTQDFVYAYPTIEALANAVLTLVAGSAVTSSSTTKADIEAVIQRHTEKFSEIPERTKTAPAGGDVLLITGSTGGLGSHILETALANSTVRRVFALNRKGAVSSADRQKAMFVDRGLDVELLRSEKLVFLEGDASQPSLGLSQDVFSLLSEAVSVIIHCAWSLDFNKTLPSFESHIQATHNLIDLARGSTNKTNVRFLLTSSVASAQGWNKSLGPFPEEVQVDAGVALGGGYGEGKYVSERILFASGLEATSFRIGQVCGSARTGAWSVSDWVPALAKSSIALGAFPSMADTQNAWITPEAVASAVVQVALAESKPPFAMNLVSPRPVAWDEIMGCMAEVADRSLIPFAEWVVRLEKRAAVASAEDLQNIPAIKLFSFFKSAQTSVLFSTSKAQAFSATIRSLPKLSAEDVRKWMSYWRERKFI
ncbi:unnamed protein product [Mycena citricolor]|uniref:Acetyl-CoA synthetase-like protein n=1 Tax=Mycena citricolor TaxID=2018698 RepID=A0AAD2H4W4_9AGAR|nr:unnamed protein product [Mycena citricolor]